MNPIIALTLAYVGGCGIGVLASLLLAPIAELWRKLTGGKP